MQMSSEGCILAKENYTDLRFFKCAGTKVFRFYFLLIFETCAGSVCSHNIDNHVFFGTLLLLLYLYVIFVKCFEPALIVEKGTIEVSIVINIIENNLFTVSTCFCF